MEKYYILASEFSVTKLKDTVLSSYGDSFVDIQSIISHANVVGNKLENMIFKLVHAAVQRPNVGHITAFAKKTDQFVIAYLGLWLSLFGNVTIYLLRNNAFKY